MGEQGELESEFHERMLRLYWEAGYECGYWANYFLRGVRNQGGVKEAKRLLAKKGRPQPGFFRVVKECKRPDLTVEALICDNSKFWVLFKE
ncbi:unnamed protein product, partial [marine sediment metagenome]